MPLVTMKQMIDQATRDGYSLGGFHINSLDDITAVLDAAESCRAPVLLDISHRDGAANNGMLMAAAEHAARLARVPVGLASTQITQSSMVVAAIRDGSNLVSIELDGNETPEKIEQACSLIELVKSCGIPVETQMALLDADVASTKDFIKRTQVDLFGYTLDAETSHLSEKQMLKMIETLNQSINVPLSLHGISRLTDSTVQDLRDAGFAVMYFTNYSPVDSLLHTRDDIRQYVLGRMLALGCTERATDVLTECACWEPVEHVIVFNVDASTQLDIDSTLAEGRTVLSQIPGVRYVHTGRAVTSGAAYQFCWLVQFVHAAVIDSYREHPIHKKYADELFRPIAPSRMSIDFSLTTQGGGAITDARQGLPMRDLTAIEQTDSAVL